MRLIFVYLCCATLAEILMKGLRRGKCDSNDWIYRRLWNDTVSDCWSLRSATWNAASRSSSSAPRGKNRGGLSQESGLMPPLRGRFAVWRTGQCALQAAKHPQANRCRQGKGRRQGQPWATALAQPRIVHIRASSGLLGWLYPLLGQGKRLNG